MIPPTFLLGAGVEHYDHYRENYDCDAHAYESDYESSEWCVLLFQVNLRLVDSLVLDLLVRDALRLRFNACALTHYLLRN